MNQNISKLCGIAGKESRLIIGLMSGTSLDGLDIALCRFTGSGQDTGIEILAFETVPYEDHFKTEVRAVFSKRSVDLEKVCLLNAWIAQQHAGMVLDCLEKWKVAPDEVDLIASHGQSIYHAPKILHRQEGFGNATLQIGDGDHLAVATGIITLSDFRQKHVAAGGEGAPLAVYGDYFIFSKKGENRLMLNIGGIANFTYLPANLDATAIFSTDTGPGNTLMDAFVQENFGLPYDRDSLIARKGTVNGALLNALMDHPFFEKDFPKTTGPELFNLAYVDEAINRAGILEAGKEDILATLNRFSATTIAGAMKRTLDKAKTFSIYSSGGGMHNPLLMEQLQAMLPGYAFQTTAALNINPDAKEALLFAILANEAVAGGNTRIGDGKKVPGVSMGKISFAR
ncbi:anhydro-N-acetylmuramic acid kinase [Sediminibacterium roseum]|uniref:Anhydro-N-acetylmuramic acid kinase n=1 Tax=Sediminibacterium roseum TaxID=1978412 RepID=A0ABW9ZXK5_9BACT|nr:anhydro-N-acetylmuramic acid kinase [Sediminibacterium roseum]NCI49596.1 anhydro-N-acetylmuramic acid kinase [Sediminibacterium roseum]